MLIGNIITLCGIGGLVVSVVGAYLSEPNKADNIEDMINKCLKPIYVSYDNGIKEYCKIIETISYDKYLISIPVGRSVNDVYKCIGAIQTIVGDGFNISIKLCKDNTALLEIEEIKEVGGLPAIIPYEVRSSAPKSITINLGVDIEGTTVSIDLKDSPHTYIVGCTGSGKSNQLRTLLLDMILKYHDVIELYCIDFKIVELALFRNCKCCKTFISDSDEVENVLSDLLEEAKRRNTLFESKDVVDIFEYNQRVGENNTLKYKVIVIEEYSMLYDNKRAVKKLKKLIAIGRSVGYFIILTVQRPDCNILDSFIKANISNRITLKTVDTKNSIIAIDKEGAELLNTGESLIRVGSDLIKYKSYYIDTNELKKQLKPFIVKKEPKKEVAPKLKPLPTIDNNDSEIDLSFLDKL